MGHRASIDVDRIPYQRFVVILPIAIGIGIVGLFSSMDSARRVHEEKVRTIRAAEIADSLHWEMRLTYARADARVDSALLEAVDSLRVEVFRSSGQRARLRGQIAQINRAMEAQAKLLRQGGK